MTSEILTPNKNYNRIRHFLRLLFLHGCYSKNTFKKYNLLSEKQYRNYSNLVMEYLDSKHHNIQQYNRESLKLDFEYYETKSNYLVDSYLTKSSTSNYMSVYFLLLQILKLSGRPMKRNEIVDKLYEVYGFHEDSNREWTKEMSETTIYNYLKEFVKLDILGENEDNEFYINDDIFEDLSNEELMDLYDGILFFSDVLYPSTPGYYLKNTLKRYMRYIRKIDLDESSCFLHRFVPFHSVLDDEIVIEILKAIKANKRIQVDYEKLVFNKPSFAKEKYRIKLVPIKIVFDLKLGRWYLACLDEESNLSMLRVDRILSVRFLKDKFNYESIEEYFNDKFKDVWTASIPNSESKPKEVKLQILNNNQYIINRLIKEAKEGQLILGEDNNNYYTLRVKDDMELLPWIRSLSPHIKIVENEELKEKLVNDLREMRDKYEAIFRD